MNYFISYYYSYPPGELLNGDSAGSSFLPHWTRGHSNATITRDKPISSIADISEIEETIRAEWL